MKNKVLIYWLLFFIILSLVKIDYRFNEFSYGLKVDDAEYYYNAATLAYDLDLDYSNQMEGVKNRNLNIEFVDKIVPFHPIGNGILSFPLLIISNIIFENTIESGLVSFNFFIYSLIPIVYLFLSIYLMIKTLKLFQINVNKLEIMLLIFGTGISYYAFDRFSMSHIYEFFAASFLIYYTTIILKNKSQKNRNIHLFLLGFLFYIFLMIRFTNYFYILIPGIVLLALDEPLKKIYLNALYIAGNIAGVSIFLVHTKFLYGIYTLNQAPIVLLVENSMQENYLRFFDLSRFYENIVFLLKSMRILNFSYEFGLFFTAPILFLGSIFILIFIFKKKVSLSLLLLISYTFPYISVIILQNTGFSYGFRYLYSLVPLNIFIFYKYFRYNFVLRNYLIVFSFIGFLSYIFFETSELTSLSQDYLLNSFGIETRYTNPNYVSNIFRNLLNIESYFHIIFTSFVGVSIIKIINIFIEPTDFFEQFTTLNTEIETLIINSIKFSNIKLLIIYSLILIFLYFIIFNGIRSKKRI